MGTPSGSFWRQYTYRHYVYKAFLLHRLLFMACCKATKDIIIRGTMQADIEAHIHVHLCPKLLSSKVYVDRIDC